ncbi:leucine--tRNA ligase [Patescibacteria group bacterium]|nr:MAG: leucine--tRNA ligase [Patescibacteria group bacterium]
MNKYNPKAIEKKWQKYWEKNKVYKKYNRPKKFYALDMFPYPSGAGLHVGHPKGYIATDVTARFKMLQGYSVLHPMGWDAFGLPAENYALKMKMHPRIAVDKNIAVFKKQLEMFGFTYDWDREVSTTDPGYYKWTQWIFLKLFEKGLAYESHEPVNWCPSCKTVLSNEDLEGNECERCGTVVEQRPMRQWVLKMTDYAERLLNDLDKEKLDWEAQIIEQQKNWIGRSEGIDIAYTIKGIDKTITVYTTRPDTNFGATFVVLAPDSNFVAENVDIFPNKEEVKKYIEATSKKTELDRISEGRKKTGVFTGLYAVNNLNGKKMPMYLSDFVLATVGTGAVVGVPGHDTRDFEFAKAMGIDIIRVVVGSDGDVSPIERAEQVQEEEGKMINSDFLNGLDIFDAKEKIKDYIEKKGFGKRKINYKMRDWVFSRQKYWGEPFPLVFCQHCADKIKSGQFKKGEFSQGELLNPGWIGMREKDLPLELPKVKSYETTGTGEGPLAGITKWVNTRCPKCGEKGRRETNTMPQWAGSSWYYLRYIDPKNKKALIDKKKEKDWMPVDLYVGGIEHATRHLLYARFWHKFLFDIKAVSTKEPFKKLIHVGLIQAEDGRKMSKRWGNVINPDDIISQFGADSIRLYEMFMGPFTQSISWSTAGVSGVRKFLEKVWRLQERVTSGKKYKANQKLQNLLHKTIKKVTEDIENFRFNTAVSSMMILVNEMDREEKLRAADYELLAVILSPFAPHMADELWSRLGHKKSIFLEKWPKWNPKLIRDEEIELVVQVNGKLRDRITVAADIAEAEAKTSALASERVQPFLTGKEIRKVIFVPGRLVNIVI